MNFRQVAQGRKRGHRPVPLWKATLIGFVLLVAILTPLDYLAGATGTAWIISPIVTGLLFTIFLSALISIPTSWLISWRARWRGEGKTISGLSLFNRFHTWEPMPQEMAEIEWARKGQLPAGGHLKAGWICRDCPCTWLECSDAHGRRYVLVGGLQPGPWLAWVVGLFMLGGRCVMGGKNTVRPAIFLRMCRWVDAAPEKRQRQLLEVGKPGPTARVARVRVCRDCAQVRIDGIDADGEDFIIFTNIARLLIPLWCAGLYFVFNRKTELPSDAPGAHGLQSTFTPGET